MHAVKRPMGRAPRLDVCLVPWGCIGQSVTVLQQAYGGFWGLDSSSTRVDQDPSASIPCAGLESSKGCDPRAVTQITRRWQGACQRQAAAACTDQLKLVFVKPLRKGGCDVGAAVCTRAGPGAPLVIAGFVTSCAPHGMGGLHPGGFARVAPDLFAASEAQVVLINPYAAGIERPAVLIEA